LLAALGLADHPGPRGCRVSGFEVLATDENQQKNKDGRDFHGSPLHSQTLNRTRNPEFSWPVT
jgi:hypothetical protein